MVSASAEECATHLINIMMIFHLGHDECTLGIGILDSLHLMRLMHATHLLNELIVFQESTDNSSTEAS